LKQLGINKELDTKLSEIKINRPIDIIGRRLTSNISIGDKKAFFGVSKDYWS